MSQLEILSLLHALPTLSPPSGISAWKQVIILESSLFLIHNIESICRLFYEEI